MRLMFGYDATCNEVASVDRQCVVTDMRGGAVWRNGAPGMAHHGL